MPDLTITAANVKPSGQATQLQQVQFGATVTPGQPVYRAVASPNRYFPCDADLSAAAANCAGICVIGGGDGDFGYIVPPGGTIDLGAVMAQGMAYYVSDTAGGIKPQADLGTGDFITYLGNATTTSLLPLRINATSVEKT